MARWAKQAAELSTCGRLQVGCLIVDHTFTDVLAIGYNGQPAGRPNTGCLAGCPGSCGCVHAEANALIKLRHRSRHMFMFCTHSPCEHCAGLIINAGISEVFAWELYRNSPILNYTLIGDHDEVLKRWHAMPRY